MVEPQEARTSQVPNPFRRSWLIDKGPKVAGALTLSALLSACGIHTGKVEPAASPTVPSEYMEVTPGQDSFIFLKPKEGTNATIMEGRLEKGEGIDKLIKRVSGIAEANWYGYSMTVIIPDSSSGKVPQEVIHFSGTQGVGEEEKGGGGMWAKRTYANIPGKNYPVFNPLKNFFIFHNLDINTLPPGTRVIVGTGNLVDANLERLLSDPRLKPAKGLLSVNTKFYPAGGFNQDQRLKINYISHIGNDWRPSTAESFNLSIDASRLTEGPNYYKDSPWTQTPPGR